MHDEFGQVCAVLGLQWGDEGKGKLVDFLAKDFDIVGRGTGGANAGHTIYRKGKKVVFHLIPAGVFHDGTVSVVGNGVVIHLPTLFEEIKTLEDLGVSFDGRLLISDRAHVVFEYHKMMDAYLEEERGAKKVGTTLRGIGPSYGDKIARSGIRVSDLVDDFGLFTERYNEEAERYKKRYGITYDHHAELEQMKDFAERLKPFVKNSADFLHESITGGKSVLLEGANGTGLDIDHGTYPYVTSSNASIGGLVTGTGVSPFDMTSAIGVVKAYTTRVGGGVFPTELENELGRQIREQGGEYGSTTGRPRRCGWYDSVLVRMAVALNGVTALNLTKLDVLSGLEEVSIGVSYEHDGVELKSLPASLAVLSRLKVHYKTMPGWKEDLSPMRKFEQLPEACRNYVDALEEYSNCAIKFIGVGPHSDQLIVRS